VLLPSSGTLASSHMSSNLCASNHHDSWMRGEGAAT
jgi:hypothetical protein